MLRRLVRSTGAKFVLAVLISYGLFQVWTSMQVPKKIDSRIYNMTDSRGRVNVAVELNFRPERFHILFMQDYGRVTGTQDNSVEVRGISLEGVRQLARKYWVRRIVPLEEASGRAVPADRLAFHARQPNGP